MKVFSNATLALAALIVENASAFWGKGHLLVARGAQAILEADHPEVFEAAMKDLAVLAETPGMIEHEKDHPFTECATYADDIKDTYGMFQFSWHFINQPYLDEEGTTVDDFDFHPVATNVVDCLTDLTAFLKGEIDATSDSTYVKQIAEVFPKERDQRSFALRMIIHYLGDIHQPLQAVAEVDSRFPEGDQGGNLQKIPMDEASGVDELHAVWDSVIYHYPGYETMPFNSDAWAYYTEQASLIHDKHPIQKEMIQPNEFMKWAAESLKLSIDVVYGGFVPGETPSQEYREKALPILEERMHYGSERLALLITDIY